MRLSQKYPALLVNALESSIPTFNYIILDTGKAWDNGRIGAWSCRFVRPTIKGVDLALGFTMAPEHGNTSLGKNLILSVWSEGD